jgi:CTP synthase
MKKEDESHGECKRTQRYFYQNDSELMKIVCITGGVYSSLWKGITAASIGKLLKACGHKVAMIKMDPYLHVDAGTMNPYAHGEVFVTEDGAETDLDLWHYERFLWDNVTANNSITSWKIYLELITKERQWVYIGQNVQVIPHVTNMIKEKIIRVGQESQADVVIVEIGGTVWDIESPAYYEAMRQLKRDEEISHICYVHLAPIVYLPETQEPKTKPLQHSVRDLRQTGIYPDVLICRTQHPMEQWLKEKIASMCDIDTQALFEWRQLSSIYQVPLDYYEQWLHHHIGHKLDLDTTTIDLADWQRRVENILNPKKPVYIWLIGKYTQLRDADFSVIEALKHAAAQAAAELVIVPIHPQDLEAMDDARWHLAALHQQGKLDAIVVPWWFGSRGTEGMIAAIDAAKIYSIPFLGICYGLQLATIAFARHQLWLSWASSTEIDPQTPHPIIDLMEEQTHVEHLGWSMRLGSYTAIIDPESHIAKLYWKSEIKERHRHRYEVNPQYHDILRQGWLRLSGMSPDGRLVEHIEITNHPYFIATQAHPEFLSRLQNPHPLFVGLVEQALKTVI